MTTRSASRRLRPAGIEAQVGQRLGYLCFSETALKASLDVHPELAQWFPIAARAAIVTRLRSLGVRSVRRHKSPNTTSFVSSANLGATAPSSPMTAFARAASEAGPRRARTGGTQGNGIDLPLGVHLVVDLECRDCTRPPAVDREVREDSGCLARLNAVIERSAQVTGELCRLSGRDQDRDSHQAAIARRQLGAPPYVAEQDVVRERRETRRDPLLHRSGRSCGGLRWRRCLRCWREGRNPVCSSVTFSIQCTFVPFRGSVSAMCVIDVCGAAPCQCFWPAGILTTSPVRMSSTRCPHCWTRPVPAVTIRTWPAGCECQALRALGSNVPDPARADNGSSVAAGFRPGPRP